MIRLDKLLCGASGLTRSQVKELIRNGCVTVDKETVRRPEAKVEENRVCVCINGKPCVYREFHYYMLHKPAGFVTATEDRRDKTVMDLLGDIAAKELFPVGRLDKDTEGLLIITNDGALAHGLLSPKKHVDKEYLVRIREELTGDDIRRLEEGIDIGDDSLTLPASVRIRENKREIILTIREGRYHQVKRMLAAVGNEVVYLKRLGMGGLFLPSDLPPGGWRELCPDEERRIKEAAGVQTGKEQVNCHEEI